MEHMARRDRSASLRVDEPVRRNIAAVAEVERAAARNRTRTDRLIDAVTGFLGRPAFLIAQPIWVAGWLVWNLRAPHPFDPYPFSLLGLVIAIEAILITISVLITQRRMTAADNRREHLNLQINLLAEAEMTKALNILHRVCKHLNVPDLTTDPEVQQLAATTDIADVARRLDEELDRTSGR